MTHQKWCIVQHNAIGDRSGVLLDISDCNLNLENAINVIERRSLERLQNNTDVLIKQKDNIVKIIRIKK